MQEIMGDMGNLIILVTSSLFLCLLLALIKILHKLWWTPMRIQCQMNSQGIKGPSYRFIYGNTKEIIKLRKGTLGQNPWLLCHMTYFPKFSLMFTYGSIRNNYLHWFGPQPQLVVAEAELVKEILNNRDGAFPKADSTEFVEKLLGDGLFTADGDKWAKQRKLANHAFHGESLKGMIPAMIARVEMMLERTAFGSSYLEGKKIFDMLMKLIELANRNAFRLRFPVIGKLWKTADEIEAVKLEKGIWNSVIGMTS
ncbi:putative Cytochrome P450 [Melia azedarach]|uniref:Cytochrome P450 n=1 Tax=Melia azedarach TaxID=155640 RepID=A0ACC1XGR2_MELAZ|nr:putative Cytochrome P450 [Melia azedarach]